MGEVIDFMSHLRDQKGPSGFAELVKGFLSKFKALGDFKQNNFDGGIKAVSAAWEAYLGQQRESDYWAYSVIAAFEFDGDYDSDIVNWAHVKMVPTRTGRDPDGPGNHAWLFGQMYVKLHRRDDKPRFAKHANQSPVTVYEQWLYERTVENGGTAPSVYLFGFILVELHDAGFLLDDVFREGDKLTLQLLKANARAELHMDYAHVVETDANFRTIMLAKGFNLDAPEK